MTAVRVTYLYCDGPSCIDSEPFRLDPGPSSPVADQRIDAARQGWHRTNGKDICPDCWEEGVR